jgi:hypothetical protein
VLLVCESRAFFSLYQTLSAAGAAAVQLDRKLLSQGAATPRAPATTSAAAAAAAAAGGIGLDTSTGGAAAAAAAAWEGAVKAALANASCVLVTHEQLVNACMPCQHFDALIEYISADSIKDAQQPASSSSGSRDSAAFNNTGAVSNQGAAEEEHVVGSSCSRREAVAKQFAGWHYVLAVEEPDLQAAAAAAAASKPAVAVAAAPAALEPLPAAAAAAAGPASAQLAAQQQPGNMAAARASTASATANQAAAAAAAAGQQARGPPDMPLLLNYSPDSVLRQRRSLYESLLQLEGQGFCLVERNLTAAAAPAAAAAVGGAASAGGSSSSSVVDVVLSPSACLCVWHAGKLPQVGGCAVFITVYALLVGAFLHVVSGTFLTNVPPHLNRLSTLARNWDAYSNTYLHLCREQHIAAVLPSQLQEPH